MSSPCPFVFHSGIIYQVVSCGFTSFITRYSRKLNCIILYCSILQDKADMGYLLRSIHHLNQYSLDNPLQLCKRKIQPNNNYNNPGNLKFVSHLRCNKCSQSRPSAPWNQFRFRHKTFQSEIWFFLPDIYCSFLIHFICHRFIIIRHFTTLAIFDRSRHHCCHPPLCHLLYPLRHCPKFVLLRSDRPLFPCIHQSLTYVLQTPPRTRILCHYHLHLIQSLLMKRFCNI